MEIDRYVILQEVKYEVAHEKGGVRWEELTSTEMGLLWHHVADRYANCINRHLILANLDLATDNDRLKLEVLRLTPLKKYVNENPTDTSGEIDLLTQLVDEVRGGQPGGAKLIKDRKEVTREEFLNSDAS